MPDPIVHVSPGRFGFQGVGASLAPTISGDGRFVAFVSASDDHVEDDDNFASDVFLRDLLLEVTTRLSLSSGGGDADAPSGAPDISADGRFVAFDSVATDIDPRANAATSDVFVADGLDGSVEPVSLLAGTGRSPDLDSQAPAISDDGRFVAFQTLAPTLASPAEPALQVDFDIVRVDRQTGAAQRLSLAPGGGEEDAPSLAPAISGSGLVVAFESSAGNLVADGPDDPFGPPQVYVADTRDGSLALASRGLAGAFGNGASSGASLSADGRYVAFQSLADNLVETDGNEASDIFVLDRGSGRIERVSVDSDGGETGGMFAASADASISGNGRWVAFASGAADLVDFDINQAVDVFVHDRRTGETALVSVSESGLAANAGSSRPVISADGQYVAFVSEATNLIDGFAFSPQPEIYRAPNPLWQDPLTGAQLLGGAGGDALDGDAGDDVISGGGGDDLLVGAGGDDSINGDAGADRVYGQAGADTAFGGDAADTLFGNAGDDSLRGDDDADLLRGQAGSDSLEAGSGADTLSGGADPDAASGGGDADLMSGDTGNDSLLGEAGADTLRGQAGADVLNGGDGDDRLLGMQGADTLLGAGGNDTLTGGAADDVLFGGAGIDVYVFAADQGSDSLGDFEDGLDRISLVGVDGFAAVHLEDTEAGARITFQAEPTTALVLAGVAAAQLTVDDFFFT